MLTPYIIISTCKHVMLGLIVSTLSQTQRIITFLKAHPDQKFTARDIAKQIVVLYSKEYQEKRQNPRFKTEKEFVSQVVAEIGAQKDQLMKEGNNICWQDKPRPRVYWYDSSTAINEKNTELAAIDIEVDDTEESHSTPNFTEQDLYPLLIDYLDTELKLHSWRINEKSSRNKQGSGGNHWLHPDIVAMQLVDKGWDEIVRSCVKQGVGQRVRLWSFEVKKELTTSNVRRSFFQAVSNSSWANEGYLVAASITNNVMDELKMLSALHGIGVLLLNAENPTESEILLPARAKADIDWQSVNRIVVENKDFKKYIKAVSTYYQTGWI